jgi:CRP/FNR family cyclic AMP-dependent transcriptional regulator
MNTASNNRISILENFSLFEGVPTQDLEWLSRHLEVKKFKKHELIYQLGDSSECLYFLTKGSVKIGTISEDGREVIKHILQPMAMFGELSLAGESKRKDFAHSFKSNTEVVILRISFLKQIMRKNYQLSMRILQFIGSRLQKVESRLESLIFKDARERIIEFLRESARAQGKKIGYELLFKHSLTQQDIANITGTSRQTVTSVLNDLKKSNLIYFNRRSILIRDIAKLA